MSDTGSKGDPALLGKRLLRGSDRAALATSLRGAPYASLVQLVTDLDASPLLLLSDLAQHSRNIAFDPRVSLLIDGTAGHADPLTGPRLTLIGRAEAIDDPRRLARFIAHQPASALYADFADFRLYRVAVARGHLVAGFGRIHWIEARDLIFAADIAALAAAEPDILRNMNDDHPDAIEIYVRHILGRAGSGWQMVGIDPEGIDLRRAGETARLEFHGPVLTAAAAHSALVELAEKARK